MDLYDCKVKDYPYNIYVLKVDKTVVYVGRAQDIHARWFGSFGRLRKSGNWFRGESTLAKMIWHNPSWNWMLQLWTVKEAARFCGLPSSASLNRVEIAMIQKLSPVTNGTHNNTYIEIPAFILAYYHKQADIVTSVYDEVMG